MREVEDRIAAWREEIASGGAMDRHTVSELESHLRDAIDHEMGECASAGDAFDLAVGQLGTAEHLESEFAKVYPALSWRRRLLLLAVGYSAVALASSLFWWVFRIVSALTAWAFPTARIALPSPIRVEPDPNDVFRAALPYEGVTISHVHASTIVGNLALLVAIIAFCAAVIWLFKCKPARFERVIRDRGSLTALAISLCGILLVVSHQFLPGLFDRNLGSSSSSFGRVLDRAGIGEHEFLLVSWWVSRRMVFVKLALLVGLAFWLLRQLRRNEQKGSPMLWLFGGYFTIAGCAGLLSLIGVTVGLMFGVGANTLAPGLAERSFYVAQWLRWFSNVSSPASLVSVVVQAVFLLAILVRVYLDLGRRRFGIGEQARGMVWRHGFLALGLWFVLFGWQLEMLPLLVVSILPEDVVDSIGPVMASVIWFPLVARGALVALLLVAVTVVAGMRNRSGLAGSSRAVR